MALSEITKGLCDLDQKDALGDDDQSLSEAYETLLEDYQQARALNDELMTLLREYMA